MIGSFDEWAQDLHQAGPLDQLRNHYVGIEAAEYLRLLPKLQIDGIQRKILEELPAALGGYPFGYEAVIQRTVEIWREYNITPVFIFSGLEVGKRDNTAWRTYEDVIRTHILAWNEYDSAHGQAAVNQFGQSTFNKPEDMFRYLQCHLKKLGVKYQVAPFGAWAQLAYLYREHCVDAVFASSEALMFDIPDAITNWDFAGKKFTWIKKPDCLSDLGIGADLFTDACLLAGSSIIPTLPFIDNTGPHKASSSKIRRAVDVLLSNNRDGNRVCIRYQDDPQFRALNYLDRYRRAKLAIKHHVIMTKEGRVEPFDVQSAPGDIHEFIGQRLPDELYFYLARGVIGPRVLNWRTSGEIFETPPLDNGDNEAYRNLVRRQLTEVRTTTIALLSYCLTRFYQHKDVTLRCWFDKDDAKVISMRDLANPKPIAESWKVSADIFGPQLSKVPRSALIGHAIKSLADTDFAQKTIAGKNAHAHAHAVLKTHDELLLNSVWRMLHLRGYTHDDHTLTPWGEMLLTMLNAIPGPEYEEAAILAVELVRLDYLSSSNFFPTYSGITPPAQDQIQRHMLLVSRVACLGKFQHKQIGFTGPLSRQLLGYHSMVAAVRNSMRDLVEVCLTTLLLNGEADRDRTDWYDLGLDLPFLLDNDCGLGLLVNNYLFELYKEPKSDPTNEETRLKAKEAQQRTFAHAVDTEGDLRRAFALWDAVYKGIQAAGTSVKNRKQFDDADAWLKSVR